MAGINAGGLPPRRSGSPARQLPGRSAAVDTRGSARENASVRRTPRSWPAWPLLLALLLAGRPARAGIEPTRRAADVPLAVDVSAARTGPGPEDMSEEPDAESPDEPDDLEEPDVPTLAESVQSSPRVIPPPTAAITDAEPTRISVAVGLGASAPGSKPEKAVVDALERAARGSRAPTTQVRRLRAGAGEGKSICRERRDDLVILLEYLPDREDAVLVTRDCRLDRELAVRGQAAAREPDLVGVLWEEHRVLVRDGAKERKVRMGRKLKTGLIAGGAIVAVALAIGLVLANSLRTDTVVLTVGP